MATESFANNASTTLSGSITNVATSLVVTSANGFPLSPQFRLGVESELMLVTALSGTTFTVTRGIEGTSGVAHSNGVSVTHVLTSGGLIGAAGLMHPDGAYSGIPAAGTTGRLFFPNDGHNILRDGGTSWTGLGPVYPMTPPPLVSNWTWINQGTNSSSGNVLQVGSSIALWSNASAGAGNVRAQVMAAPATPYTITAFMKAHPGNSSAGFNQFGIGWRRSTGGTNASGFILLAWVNNQSLTNPIWQFNKWTSPTVFSADYVPSPNAAVRFSPHTGFWMRISDDGTNLAAGVSYDGLVFQTLRTVSRTDFFGNGPDQVCFFIDPEADFLYMSLYSWTQT